MASFQDTPNEHGDAPNEATNGSGPVRDEAKYQLARDAGWVQPQAYNYEAAMAKPGDVAQTSIVEQVDLEDMPGWMHSAMKYEWQEDYGDVGPEVPELEAQLFRNDSRTRTGQFLDK